MSGIFNIPPLDLDSTFEGWYIKDNEIISSVNQIQILDAVADTNKGIIESFRGGGVVAFGINAGFGLTFGDDGSLTFDASDGLLKNRPDNADRIFVVVNATTTPEIRVVTASNMLPSQINNDINFTGNVTFSGDLSFITTGTVTLEANTTFSDKQLELAAKFRDVLNFATTASASIGISTYLCDIDVVDFDFSTFDPNNPATYLAQGILSGIDTANNVVYLSEIVFVDPSDDWTEFTDSGATAGGKYLVLDDSGNTVGRGLLSRSQDLEPRPNQTTPIDASDAGIIVITNDETVPVGGSAGHKKFTWVYNGSTSASAWTSSEHLAVVEGKYLDTRTIRPTGSLVNLTSGSSTATFGFTDPSNSSDYFRIMHNRIDPDRTLVFSGNSNGAGQETILTMVADGTMIAGTTAVALNLNADMIDGAHGMTIGGTPNTVAITNDSGKIDQTFIEGTHVVNEDITFNSHGFQAGHVIRKMTDGGFTLARANTAENAEAIGIVQEVQDANNFTVAYFGVVDATNFTPSLGYERNGGGTVAVYPGEVYYLDPDAAGKITRNRPNDIAEVIKPIVLGLESQRIEVLHYVGAEVFDQNDAVFAESLVPVGTVLWTGAAPQDIRYDFLLCDGTMYTSANYPELNTAIKDKFYLRAFRVSNNTLVIPTSDGSARGFVTGQTRLTLRRENGDLIHNDVLVTSVNTSNPDNLTITINQSVTDTGWIRAYGYNNYFLVPDLRGRFPLGYGDSGVNISTSLGQIIDGYGTSTTPENQIGSLAFTPIIRSKPTANAFIATGHNHDDRYLRLTGGTMQGSINMASNDISQIRDIIFASGTAAVTGITMNGRSINMVSGNINMGNGNINMGSPAGQINMNTGKIVNLANAVVASDALPLGQMVSLADAKYIIKTVGTTQEMNNTIKMMGSSQLDMNTKKIVNVPTPTAASDAVNKAYVDNKSIAFVNRLFMEDVNSNPATWDSTKQISGVESGIYYLTIEDSFYDDATYIVNGVPRTVDLLNHYDMYRTCIPFIIHVSSNGLINIEKTSPSGWDKIGHFTKVVGFKIGPLP